MRLYKDKSTNKRSCVVQTCEHERFDLVHKFPMEPDRTEQWLNAVNIERLWNTPLERLRSSYFVCSRHFRNEDYKNSLSRSLNKTAVPCLNLRNLNEMHLVMHRSCKRPIELQNTQIIPVPATQAKHPILEQNHEPASSSLLQPQYQYEYHIENTEMTPPSQAKNQLIILNGKQKFINNIQEYTENCTTTNTNLLDASQNDHEHLKNIQVEIDGNALTITQIKTNPNALPDHNNIQDIIQCINHNNNNQQLQIDENTNFLYKTLGAAHTTTAKNEQNDEIIYENEEDEAEAVIDMENNYEYYQKEKRTKYVDEIDEIFEMTPEILEITHPHYLKPLHLNYFWLRDHCKCKICYNSETSQRNYNLLDISLNIKPLVTEVKSDTLHIQWEDHHKSEYELKFLYAAQLAQVCKNATPIEHILWDREKLLNATNSFTKCEFGNFIKDDNLAIDVVKSLLQYGLAFIENVPATTVMTEMAIRRLFPIQKTFFGEMWKFSDQKDHADTAYSKQYLSPHTDNTYFNDPAGLQIFHCTKHIEGTGGETILIDGFKVLNDLRFTNPNAFEMLCHVNIPCEYIEDGQHHKFSGPIIKLNSLTKEPEQIRYNMYDRSVFNTLPQNQMQNFYENYRALISIVQSPQNQYRFKLTPGTVLIFDNWRLLHGREKYDGCRFMTGCYVSRTDFLSTARIFKLIN